MKIKTTAIKNEYTVAAVIADAIAVDGAAKEGREAIMTRLAAWFGEDALREKGMKYRVVRGKNPAKAEAEAERFGLSIHRGRDLADIVEGINAHRKNAFQDFQRAYFGRDKKAVTPREEAPAVTEAKQALKDAETESNNAKAALFAAKGRGQEDRSAEEASVSDAKDALNEARAALKAAREEAKEEAKEEKGEEAKETLQRVLTRALALAEQIENMEVHALVTEALETL